MCIRYDGRRAVPFSTVERFQGQTTSEDDEHGDSPNHQTDVIRTAKQFCLGFSRQESQAMDFVSAAVPIYCSST
jgi:hypothetical protein